MRSRLIAVSVLSLLGVAFFATTRLAQAFPVSNLTLNGLAVVDAPVSFSARGLIAGSSARIVVIPGAAGLVGAAQTAQAAPLSCYTGVPAAIGTADVTADASGNVAPTMVWASAKAGSYQALLLQGACVSVVVGGRSMAAVTDQVIVGQAGFIIGESVPAISAWGIAALGLALSVAGWAFLSRTRA